MQTTEIFAKTGGLQSIARELGLSDSQAESGAAALIPAILGGFKNQARSQPQGVEGLGGLLNQLGGGDLLDDVLSSQPTHADRGDNVLGQIFGSKDVSRAVAQNAASQSGLDTGVLKKMLPMVAMVVAGYMAKQPGASATPASGGGLTGMLGSLLGGRSASSGTATPGESPGFASLIDMDGDGNPLNDILRTVGKIH